MKMGMSINTNAGAEFASIAAQRAAAMMDEAMLRLSTGKRINSAKDDAAGMAVATRLAKEIAGLGQALRNANDAQGLIDTGEAALKEVHTLLLRMREIAVSASSDTNTDADRAALDTEVTALETEISRIGDQTSWGGKNILDGTHSKSNPIRFHLGPTATNFIDVTLGVVSIAARGSDLQGSLSLTGSVSSRANAVSYIAGIDAAISIISARRGNFGAVSNRLTSAITNLETMKSSMVTAKGQVEDANYAEETAKLARAQILMQAATAMLAQANASKNATLKLVTG
jgi:flagellin